MSASPVNPAPPPSSGSSGPSNAAGAAGQAKGPPTGFGALLALFDAQSGDADATNAAALLTGVFASNAINSASKGWIHDHNVGQMVLQLEDIGATFVYCGVVTFVILLVIKSTIGLRVSEEVEVEGLDINLHGEVVQA
jgi:hypothetical protein